MTERRLDIHAVIIPAVDWPVLLDRARRLEQLGVSTVWIDDHVAHPGDMSRTWLDSWSALSALAGSTERLRLGSLVSSPVLRTPVMLARQALSVEHISGGRLELGMGAGYTPSDHAAVGVPQWPAAERAERFRAAVTIVDAVLRGLPVDAEVPFAARVPELGPRPVQRPRPPLTVAAHEPKALRVAAEFGDRWVSYGGFGLGADEHYRLTAQRLAGLERACEDIGRDPATIRRALLIGSAATTPEPIWQAPDAVRRLLDRYGGLGIDDVILYYPPSEVWPDGPVVEGVFEQVVAGYR